MKTSDLKTLTNLPVATQLTGHGVGLGVGGWNSHSDFFADRMNFKLQKIGVCMYGHIQILTNTGHFSTRRISET